ncbi:hypothetical protein TbrSNM41_24430 (plasmid) [Thermus brockianus]|uniref:Uncharacterized protein n=1 Tax=Thermus brockianus TaxID=56956 RepID=A0ABM7XMW8_THEBO|nr:hypothetical protein TbrSNM41_24430 [Thermus brockianus]
MGGGEEGEGGQDASRGLALGVVLVAHGPEEFVLGGDLVEDFSQSQVPLALSPFRGSSALGNVA